MVNLERLINDYRADIENIALTSFNKESEKEIILEFVINQINQINSSIKENAVIDIEIIDDGIVMVNFVPVEGKSAGTVKPVIILEKLLDKKINLTELINNNKNEIMKIKWEGINKKSEHDDILEFVINEIDKIDSSIKENAIIDIEIKNDDVVMVKFKPIASVAVGDVDPVQIIQELPTLLVNLTELIEKNTYAIEHINWSEVDKDSGNDDILSFIKKELNNIDPLILLNSTVTISNSDSFVTIAFKAIDDKSTGAVKPIKIIDELPTPLVDIKDLIVKNETEIKSIEFVNLDNASIERDILKFIKEELNKIDKNIISDTNITIEKNNNGKVKVIFEHINGISIGDGVVVEITQKLPEPLVNLTKLIGNYKYSIEHINWDKLNMEWNKQTVEEYVKNIMNEIDNRILENSTLDLSINDNRIVTLNFKAIAGKSTGNVNPITIIVPVKKSIIDLVSLVEGYKKQIEYIDWINLKDENVETIKSFVIEQINNLNNKIITSADISIDKKDGIVSVNFKAIDDISTGIVEPIKIIAKLPSAIVEITKMVEDERNIISNIDWKKESLTSDNPKIVKEYLTKYFDSLLDSKLTKYTTFDIDINENSIIKVSFKSIPNLSKGVVDPIIIKNHIEINVKTLIGNYQDDIKNIGKEIKIKPEITKEEVLELIKPKLDKIDKDILKFTDPLVIFQDDFIYVLFQEKDGKSFGRISFELNK